MKTVLYSNFYDSDRYDEVQNFLADDLGCTPDEVSSDEVWDYINNENDDNWHDLKRQLRSIDQDAPAFLLCAECYSNYPSFHGYSHRSGLRRVESLLDAFHDLGDYVEIWTEDGRLFCKYAHHDGGGEFEIRAINERGNQLFHSWDYGYSMDDKSEWDVLHLLTLNFYSHRIDLDAAA